MLNNIGKYKILGALTGTGAGAYGSYELYNQFGRSLTSSSTGTGNAETTPSQEISPIAEQIIQQPQLINKEEKAEEEEAKAEVENIQEPVEQIQESPKVEPGEEPAPAKEEPQPQVEVREEQEDEEEFLDDDDDDYFGEESSPQPGQGSSTTGTGTEIKTYFTPGNDGSIKMGSHMSKFKDNVITSVKEESTWKDKVNSWRDDLDTSKQSEEGRTKIIAQEFFFDKTREDRITNELQHRCYTAYNKRQWVSSGNKRSTETIKNYWELVWKYCGKPSQQMPQEWYRG